VVGLVSGPVMNGLQGWTQMGGNARLPQSGADADRVIRMTLDDEMISPITAEYIRQGLETAREKQARLVIIGLDTPGGLLGATHDIIKIILNSPIPVAVYVSPGGGRAASAGVFITMAGHIAAMEPSTHIGAAHPVDLSGKWPVKQGKDQGVSPDADGRSETPADTDVMSTKIMNDTISTIRVLARMHNRNEEWAVRAVTHSDVITAEEAYSRKVVDVLAYDDYQLLGLLNGRTVTVMGRQTTLDLDQPVIEPYSFSIIQQWLNLLTNPMLTYILLMVGFYGILFEVTHPGIGIAGVIGTVSLFLALAGLQILSVNMTGLVLVGLGLAFFIMEIFTPTFGFLLAGGIISLVLGTLLLYQTGEPFLTEVIPPIVATAVVLAGLTGWLLWYVMKTYRHKPQTIEDKLLNQRGRVVADIPAGGRGKVRVYGEVWDAVADAEILKDQEVTVVGTEPGNHRVLRVAMPVNAAVSGLDPRMAQPE
jgi:membrane-bound serine protease (ClpP class)